MISDKTSYVIYYENSALPSSQTFQLINKNIVHAGEFRIIQTRGNGNNAKLVFYVHLLKNGKHQPYGSVNDQ